MMMKSYKTVDEYIASYPKHVQKNLKMIRKEVKKIAPKSDEMIRYGMPAYKLNGPLVYFAAYEKHIGFYPTPSGIKEFKKELSKYKTSKGAVQFPIDQKIPIQLIKKIVKFRVKQN